MQEVSINWAETTSCTHSVVFCRSLMLVFNSAPCPRSVSSISARLLDVNGIIRLPPSDRFDWLGSVVFLFPFTAVCFLHFLSRPFLCDLCSPSVFSVISPSPSLLASQKAPVGFQYNCTIPGSGCSLTWIRQKHFWPHVFMWSLLLAQFSVLF